MRVATARSSARAGRKDEARDFLRFVRNARIIQILKPLDFGQLGVNVPLLEWELSQLDQECHPSSPNDQTEDIAAIRSSIETLAFGIQTVLKHLSSTKTNP